MHTPLWYVNDGQGPQGPLPEPQVIELLVAGRIRSTAYFAAQGSNTWLSLDQVPVFHRAIGQGRPLHQPAQGPGYPAPGPGYPHGPMGAPGMPPRPMPPRAKSQAGTIAAVVVVGLAAVGFVGYRYFGGRRYSDLPKLEATVKKEKVSKDGKTITITLELESETKGPVSVHATSGSQTLRLIGPADVEDGVLKVKLEAGSLPAGESEITLSLNAEGYRGLYSLPVKVKMPPRLTGSGARLWVSGGQGSVELKDGMIKVVGEKGTKVTVGAQEVTVTGASQQTPLDIVALVENKKVSELKSAAAKVPVNFTLSDGTKLTGELEVYPVEVTKALSQKLQGAMKGPVTFGKGDEAPPKPRALADVTGSSLTLYGDGPGVRSIDLVADGDYTTRTSSCGTYRNTATGVVVSIGREMNDKKYTIYERRTGKVVGSRFFRAPLPECPQTLTQEQTVSSYPDSAQMEAYLESLVKK